MSTGLTYLTIVDEIENSQIVFGTYIFSSYEEAFLYGKWMVRLFNPGFISITIWTSGPNDNGYWIRTDEGAIFTPVV